MIDPSNNPGTTGSVPNVLAINSSGGGATDGYAYLASVINENIGMQQAILDYGGLAPNGITEATGASQIIDAIENINCTHKGTFLQWTLNDDPAVFGAKCALLQGDLLLVASYPKLVANMWVGTVLNPTANAFYRTDVTDTTRSDAGTHIKLLDGRGLSAKMIGDALINTRLKVGPVNLFDQQEDQMFDHDHETSPFNPISIYSSSTSFAAGAQIGETTGGSLRGAFLVTNPSDNGSGAPRTGDMTRDATFGTQWAVRID